MIARDSGLFGMIYFGFVYPLIRSLRYMQSMAPMTTIHHKKMYYTPSHRCRHLVCQNIDLRQYSHACVLPLHRRILCRIHQIESIVTKRHTVQCYSFGIGSVDPGIGIPYTRDVVFDGHRRIFSCTLTIVPMV